MIDTKNRLDSIVNSILGVYSDLQTNTRRCRECNAVAVFCSNQNVYSYDKRVPKVFFCEEHAIDSGIDYEEVDENEDDDDYTQTDEEE